MPAPLPTLRLNGIWNSLFEEAQHSQLAAVLPAYIGARRWFGGKARARRGITIADAIPIPTGAGPTFLLLVKVEYLDEDTETYVLPLAFAAGAEADRLEADSPALAVARTDGAGEEMRGVLYDATGSADFAKALLDAIVQRRTFEHGESRIECAPTSALEQLGIHADTKLVPKLSAAEHSNSAIRFGDRLLLKIFRRPESGINPDIELGLSLTSIPFRNAPPLAGTIEYQTRSGEPRALAVLYGFVPGAIDGWELSIEALKQFFARVPSELAPSGEAPTARLDGTIQIPPLGTESLLGTYLESARLLGRRTAEMHLALAANRRNPDLAPEPFTPAYQRGLSESMCRLARQNLSLLKSGLGTLTGEARELGESVLDAEAAIIERFRRIAETPLTGLRIRIHGDFHLGQTLYTGRDFFIVDFEGEPAVPLSERRMKRTPFEDVAGLLRSFNYAANAALRSEIEHGAISPASGPRFIPWAERWRQWISTVCLESYLAQPGIAEILPASIAERAVLLETHLLRKAVYELGYEVNNRPDWLPIPCRGILNLLRDGVAGT